MRLALRVFAFACLCAARSRFPTAAASVTDKVRVFRTSPRIRDPSHALTLSRSLQPPAVIFHLSKRYAEDTHARKLNLGIGVYRDALLQPFMFSAVRKAEAAVIASGCNKEYLPIAGLPAFRVRDQCGAVRPCCYHN